MDIVGISGVLCRDLKGSYIYSIFYFVPARAPIFSRPTYDDRVAAGRKQSESWFERANVV
jgi:hypothetical protein